jgi:hypothetical protein
VRIRPLITSGEFGPRALAIIGTAFDQAWQAVESFFTGPLSRQAARLILANAILADATDDSCDPRSLAWIGIHELARRGYLGIPQTPRQRALLAIVESQRLVSVSRAELRYLRTSARSARKSVERTSALLQTARSGGFEPQAGLENPQNMLLGAASLTSASQLRSPPCSRS